MRSRLILGVLLCTAALPACGVSHQFTESVDIVTALPAVVTVPPSATAEGVAAATSIPTTEVSTTTTAPAPTTTVPVVTEVPTTPAPPTTMPPPPPPTTLFVAPVPVPAPADATGNEPVVDLGTIEIPALGVSAAMYEGIRLTTLNRGPGHWPGTPLPGQRGNMVIGGHRTSHSRPFRHLERLSIGDQVIFNNSGGRFVYTVTGSEVIAPTQAEVVLAQTSAATATLFACHPPGSTRQRIVIHLALAG